MDNLQNQLTQIMTQLQLEDAPVGGAVVVYHKGQLVAQASVGQATPRLSWNKDRLGLNFSTGKGVLVTLVHILVSNKILAYDQPISQYWPEFAANGKQQITLRQVLTHRSGLFNIQAITDFAPELTDWQLMLQRVEQMPPQATFNEQAESAYSALVSGWVIGGLIEKATNLSLNEALQQYLTEPLGISDSMYFGVPADKIGEVGTVASNFDDFDTVMGLVEADAINEDEADKTVKKRSAKPKLRSDSEATLAAYQSLPSYSCWQQLLGQKQSDAPLKTLQIANLYFDMSGVKMQDFKYALVPAGRSEFNYHTPESLMAKIPAANNVASADALAKMYAMLANKGIWQGKRLIDESVFDELSSVHVAGSDAIMPATHPQSMHWRLGYHRIFSRCQPAENLQYAFGHMGYNGSMAWCDTQKQLAVAYVHNYDVTMTTDIRQFALIEAILAHFSKSID